VEELVIGEFYRHWKGGLYQLIDIVRDSDDCSIEIVIYEQLGPSDFTVGQRWARRKDEFTDIHPSGNKRFTLEE
jgi:hypothetical protein